MMVPLLAGTVGALVTGIATPLVARAAREYGLFAPAGGRHIHSDPVPRLGGLAILTGAAAGLGVALLLVGPHPAPPGTALPLPPALVGVLTGAAIVFAAGVIDDLRGLRPAAKLTAQLVAAVLVYRLGFRIDQLSWGGASVGLGGAAMPVTLLWIVGVTNAYNLVDGMDGLAAGMGVIASAAILAAAGALGHGEVVLVAAVLLGALMGFLPYNFHPARIFMGDSGSLLVGFLLAVLSVQGSMKSATAVLVAVPLFALAIPLLDTAVAIARRWLRGSPIYTPDARHLHHRLTAAGFSQRDAVLILYLCAVGFASLGILLSFLPDDRVALIATIGGAGSALLLVNGMRHLGYDEFLLAGKVLASGPRRVRRVIRDRILVADVARAILAAPSTTELRAVLDDAARELGLMAMTVADHDGPRPDHCADGTPEPAWTLEFPLCDHLDPGRHPVLRIRGRVRDGGPRGVDRIAHLLAPTLRTRLAALGLRCDPEGPGETTEPASPRHQNGETAPGRSDPIEPALTA